MLEELGSDAHVFFHVEAPRITAETLEAREETRRCSPTRSRSSPPASTRARAAHVNDTLRLAVDPPRFHFFDAATGANLSSRDGRAPQRRRPSRRETVRPLGPRSLPT